MNLPWTECFNLSQKIVEEMKGRFPAETLPTYLLIGRGGLAMGMMMSRFCEMEAILYLPIHHPIPYNTKPLTPYRMRWSSSLGAASTTFLIDDIYDTGRTIEVVGEELLVSGACRNVVAITLLSRHGGRFKQGPHIVGQDINTSNHVIFPWEVYDPLQEVPF